MTCTITYLGQGECSVCRRVLRPIAEMVQQHTVDGKTYCAVHCPHHRTLEPEEPESEDGW